MTTHPWGLGGRPADPAVRLLAGATALLLGGSAQVAAVSLGVPMAGMLVAIPCLALVVTLWRPSLIELGILAAALGIEALIVVHTGASRYFDWYEHYQMALAFAGLPISIPRMDLLQRTPIFDALLSPWLLIHAQYWVFQIGSVLLNTLWLWPARLLLARLGTDSSGRLLAVAACPMLLINLVYTWPWELVIFFLLAAAWFALEARTVATLGLGLTLAGALMVHPGSIGYVLGLALWIGLRQTRRVLPVTIVGLATILGLVPWMVFTTQGHLSALITHSEPVAGSSGVLNWLATRPILLLTSVIPDRGQAGNPIDATLALFNFSLAAALVPSAILARRRLTVPEPVAWMVVGGLVAGWLLQPPPWAPSGIAEIGLPAVALLLISWLARTSGKSARAITTMHSALGTSVAAILIFEGATAKATDLNLVLKVHNHLRYLVNLVGPLPGILAAAAGIGLIVWSLTRAGATDAGRQPAELEFGGLPP